MIIVEQLHSVFLFLYHRSGVRGSSCGTVYPDIRNIITQSVMEISQHFTGTVSYMVGK